MKRAKQMVVNMNTNEVKDLMKQFDGSTLREFEWATGNDTLHFSKNEGGPSTPNAAPVAVAPATPVPAASVPEVASPVEAPVATPEPEAEVEGEAVESPLVGVIYLKSAPDKPEFIKVGDSVKKGQTLLIIEAMKVMNEIPAPKAGVVTEVLVANEEVVEFGQALVRIK